MADPCTEEFFATQSEKYQTIKAYFKKEKFADQVPDTTPVYSLEEVKTTCDAMTTDVEAVLGGLAEDHTLYYRVLGMRSTLLYEKARLLIKLSLVDESHQLLSTAVDIIVNHALKPEISFLILRIINHFAYSLAATDVLDMSLLLLEQAENIYFMIRTKSIAAGEGNSATPPTYFTADDLFSPGIQLEAKPETGERLERLVTNNFQMMTFIYSRVEREDLYNAYQNRVLNRQLQMREGDALNWAGKTTKLAQGFLQKLQFENARTHLAAASDVLNEYHTDLKKMDQTETTQERLSQIDYRAAELGRTWVKYALTLFSTSKHALIEKLFHAESGQCEFFGSNPFPDDEHQPQPTCEICGRGSSDAVAATGPAVEAVDEKPPAEEEKKTEEEVKEEATVVDTTKKDEEPPKQVDDGDETQKDGEPTTTEKESEQADAPAAEEGAEQASYEVYTFPTLDLSYIEARVQAEHVVNTKEARSLFTFSQPWLKRTMSYYNIQDHPAEYVNCILDLSELYRYLAFYEEDTDTQYNVQKRRSDTLETLNTVLREGNPGTYIGASVELYRELAEVQIEMLGLNLRRLYTADAAAEEEVAGSDATDGVGCGALSHRAQWEMHKLEAVKDIHGRLQEFGTYLLDADMHQDDDDDGMTMPPNLHPPAEYHPLSPHGDPGDTTAPHPCDLVGGKDPLLDPLLCVVDTTDSSGDATAARKDKQADPTASDPVPV